MNRLLSTNVLKPQQEEAIQRLRGTISVLDLYREIYRQLFQVKLMPNATPGEQENIYHTLTHFSPHIEKGGWQPKLDYHLMEQLLLAYP